jgi:hypothetical protein
MTVLFGASIHKSLRPVTAVKPPPLRQLEDGRIGALQGPIEHIRRTLCLMDALVAGHVKCRHAPDACSRAQDYDRYA